MVGRDRELPANSTQLMTETWDSGILLIWAKRHKGIHSKSGMAAYQGGVVTGGVSIVIIVLCVTNITSNLHLNNAI